MTERHDTICLFCSLGCGLSIETDFEEALNLEYNTDNEFGGALCSRGNYLLELINHPFRLTEPAAKGNRFIWPDALAMVKNGLGKITEPGTVGLIVCPELSDEEAASAKLFAESTLGGGPFAVNFPAGDNAVINALASIGISAPTAAIADFRNAACVISVGDPFETGPVIAGPVMKQRYARRGNMLAVVSENSNRTSRFATHHLTGPVHRTLAHILRIALDISTESKPKWANEIMEKVPVVDDPGVRQTAEMFVKSPGSILVLDTGDPVTAKLAGLLTMAAGTDKKILPLMTSGNAFGICNAVGDTGSVEAVIDSAADGSLKGLIVLGADIVKSMPDKDVAKALFELEYLLAAAPFENETAKLADMVLPSAVWLESAGTYNGKSLRPVISPPGGALSYGELLRSIAREIGKPLSEVHPERVLAPGTATAEEIASMLTLIDIEPQIERICSTVTRYADGSLTDMMGYIQMQERTAW